MASIISISFISIIARTTAYFCGHDAHKNKDAPTSAEKTQDAEMEESSDGGATQ